MSHVPATHVAQAFMRLEKAGKGLENRTEYELGIHEGNMAPVKKK
jgi:hypothetical protein